MALALMHGVSIHTNYNKSFTSLVIMLKALAWGADTIEEELNLYVGKLHYSILLALIVCIPDELNWWYSLMPFVSY